MRANLHLLSACIIGILAARSPAMAQVPELPPMLSMEWLDLGNGCFVLADAQSHEPIINPDDKDSYAVGREDSCPQTTAAGGKLATFERAAVQSDGLRLYAEWGRIYVFRFYPAVEQWGYGQKFRFEWVSSEESSAEKESESVPRGKKKLVVRFVRTPGGS